MRDDKTLRTRVATTETRPMLAATAPNDDARPRCRNCGAGLGGAYCSVCGQRDVPLDPSFGELAAEAWDAVVSVDGKLLASLRRLVLRPGELTAQHLAGRRAPYFGPLRLYVTCSVAFFLLQAVLPESSRAVKVGTSMTGVSGVHDPLSPIDSLAGIAGPEWSRRIQRGLRRAEVDRSGFSQRALEQMPKVVGALVPLQALLLAAAYRRRRMRLPTHFVFALHAHAFFFVAATAVSIAELALPRGARDWGEPALIVATLAYGCLAMRRVYGGR